MQPMSCSGRFLRPFLKVLAHHPELGVEIERLIAQPIEQRVELEHAHERVRHWVCVTHDPDIGLRAGEMACLGSGGPLDYVPHSAPTLRDGVIAVQRHVRLYSDGMTISIVGENERASIRFESSPTWPRAISDFVLSTWYRNLLLPHLGTEGPITCCFSYPEPESIALQRRVFAGAALHFDAGFDGFEFEARLLDLPLASADALLHATHCEHLDMLQVADPEPRSVATRVQQLIAVELQRGRPTSAGIARKLHMSRRTLVRRLYAEGTTFSLQLDEMRRQLALRLVVTRALPLAGIAALLGFSHVQAFHRAFKRWTGLTPLRYRDSAHDETPTAPN
jgi:AraC-like DNA-binding protein